METSYLSWDKKYKHEICCIIQGYETSKHYFHFMFPILKLKLTARANSKNFDLSCRTTSMRLTECLNINILTHQSATRNETPFRIVLISSVNELLYVRFLHPQFCCSTSLIDVFCKNGIGFSLIFHVLYRIYTREVDLHKSFLPILEIRLLPVYMDLQLGFHEAFSLQN